VRYALSEFSQRARYLVGIDSDGCVFDSMEIKHKECFCPRFIQHYSLQAVSTLAREAWEFVNLYSTTRGINRFKAVLRALDVLGDRPEVSERGVEVPQLPHLRAWVESSDTLSNAALTSAIDALGAGDQRAELERVMAWSLAVNATVAEIVSGVPPFPGVRRSLEALRSRADIVVVSQTPLEALEREWRENEIDEFVSVIAGQEQGSKAEHLAICIGDDRYGASRTLMVGDAPGDRSAAESVGALFFPIIPGRETESWQRFHEEVIEAFFADRYAGTLQRSLLDEFERALPEDPPWTNS
jgi:phosphoglycolate phosphatase-like HAD superfamily hydrolase